MPEEGLTFFWTLLEITTEPRGSVESYIQDSKKAVKKIGVDGTQGVARSE